MRRASRIGALEQVLSLVYVYPFRCQLCRRRFRALQWGVRYTKQPEDTRQYKRQPMTFLVTFSGQQMRGEGVGTDLSLGGCRLRTDAQLWKGTLLQVQVQPQGCDLPIVVEAAVVRSVQSTVAFQFLRFTPDQKERLSQVMRHAPVARRQ